MRLILLCGLSLLSPVAQADPSSRVEGDHFAVALDFTDDALAKQALAQLEKLWKPAAELYDLKLDPLDAKLEVYLYRDTRAYEKADERITGGKFQRNLAFADGDSRSAHVALQPELSNEVLARVGLPYLTRVMLLHEAAHIVRYHAMANHPSHPGWLADGAAQTLKFEVMAPGAWEQAPLSSMSTVRAQRALTKGMPPATGILLDQTRKLQFYDRYAMRAAFFRYLYESDRANVIRMIGDIRRLGGGGDFTERAAKVVAQRLGAEKFKSLDADFRRSVAGRKPVWEEVYRSLAPIDRGFVQIAFPRTNAIAWRTERVGKKEYEFRARVELLQGARQQLNVLLDRSDAGFICIALNAQVGLTIFEYSSKDNRWNRLQSKPHAAIAVGKPFDLSARVSGKQLEVRIGQDLVATAEFPQRAMDGAYGLGALSGSAGIWTDVSVRDPK